MPLLRSLIESRSFDAPIGSDDPRMVDLFGSQMTASGKRVTDVEALATSGVYASVRLISESIAALPAHVVRKAGRGRTTEDRHPVQRLIHEVPNPEMDAGEFWRFMLVYALFSGNGYAWIERGPSGQPVALWPVPASRVTIARGAQTRRLVYDVNLSEDETGPGHARSFRVLGDDIMHVRAFGTHRLYGASPIQAARESIGTARSAQDYAARFYANDATPGGTLQVPSELTDEQYERLDKAWKASHQGAKRAHMLAILENGATWQQVGITPQDAEFITTRKFELREIARIFGVPPHLIGDTEASTSWGSGIEQQNIAFLQYSLMPWITRLERVATSSLLRRGPAADEELFVRWQPDALLRGDIAARYAAYAVGKQWGFESTNSIMELEDRPPVDGGDDYLVPENMRRMLGADEEDLRDLARRVEMAAALVRVGFDPQAAAGHLGIDVAHLGVLPVTVQSLRPVDEGAGARHLPAVETRASDATRSSEIDRHLDALVSLFGMQRDELLARMGDTRPTTVREVWDTARWDDELAGMFRRLAGITATAFGRAVDDGYDGDAELGSWLAANARIAAEEVNGTTVDQLDAQLQADTDGQPSAIVTAAVATMVADRAVQIAQTRVTTVGQAAQLDAAEKAPGVATKTWRVTSGNPRESHAAVDGETVPVGERFSNGARYPGDPNLDIAERAGCSCDLDFG